MHQSIELHHRLCDLLDGGDWACSYGQCGTLSHICRQLAQLLDDPVLIGKADQVAREAAADLCMATRHWAELADLVRRSARGMFPCDD